MVEYVLRFSQDILQENYFQEDLKAVSKEGARDENPLSPLIKNVD